MWSQTGGNLSMDEGRVYCHAPGTSNSHKTQREVLQNGTTLGVLEPRVTGLASERPLGEKDFRIRFSVSGSSLTSLHWCRDQDCNISGIGRPMSEDCELSAPYANLGTLDIETYDNSPDVVYDISAMAIFKYGPYTCYELSARVSPRLCSAAPRRVSVKTDSVVTYCSLTPEESPRCYIGL